MLKRPRLRHGLVPSPIAGKGVVFLAEGQSFFLADPRLERLIPLLDGRRTVGEIQDALDLAMPPVEVSILIAQLARKGYVYEAPDETVIDPAFWASLGIHPSEAQVNLRRRRLQIHSLHGAPCPEAEDLLGEYAAICQGEDVFDIVFIDDYLSPELAEWNRRAVEEGKSWMLAKTTGREIWYGPIFVPGTTGCWECLAQRLRMNRQVETFLSKGAPLVDEAFSSKDRKASPLGTALVGDILVKWLGTGKSEAKGAVFTHDMAGSLRRRHVLVRRPQCATCGDSEIYARSALAPMKFQAVPKLEKPFAAEDAFARLAHHISPITGIVREVVPLRIPDAPFLQIQIAHHSQCDRYENFDWLRESLKVFSAGKGTTEAEARISALAESIEVHLTTRQGDEPIVHASRQELGAAAIEPESMTLFSQRQQEAGTHPRAWTDVDSVPPRIDPTTPLSWMPVWSLTEGGKKYAPADLLFWDVDSTQALAGFATTNGSAASWSLETAFLHGFFELIERDAAGIWWYNRLRRPALDLSAFADPFVQETLLQQTKIGRNVWVLDLTHDFKIPVFVALSAQEAAPHGQPNFGFGCHLDSRRALRKAMTEMNQMMPWVYRSTEIPEEDSGIEDSSGRVASEWFSSVNLENQPWLAPSSERARGPEDFIVQKTTDYLDDIAICLQRARELGIEVLMLERTRPDIALSVVKVIAPGLRHFYPRFAPGRLYDVPVAMGWLEKPHTEEGLNPIPIFV